MMHERMDRRDWRSVDQAADCRIRLVFKVIHNLRRKIEISRSSERHQTSKTPDQCPAAALHEAMHIAAKLLRLVSAVNFNLQIQRSCRSRSFIVSRLRTCFTALPSTITSAARGLEL